MGKAFIQESTLTDIADAIRSKNGSSDTYLPSEMAQAIQNIPTGGDNTNYFYVEDASGSANTLTIKKSNNALPDKVFDWSLDKQTWTTVTVTDTTGVSIAVPANGRVYLRGNNGILGADISGASHGIMMDCNSDFNAGGDITTLLQKIGSQFELPDRALYGLFKASRIKSAADMLLPSVRLMNYCYNAMFYESQLIEQPQFPDVVNGVGVNPFQEMLYKTHLTKLILPDIIGDYAYRQICQYSTDLLEVEIKATQEISYGLTQAFKNCSNLQKVVVHYTTWTVNNASMWLSGVAATGDFYNLGGATIPTGANGIPSGWTEHTTLP